jgi:hypothetical protein
VIVPFAEFTSAVTRSPARHLYAIVELQDVETSYCEAMLTHIIEIVSPDRA